jgi:hypothetical protein
LGETSVSWEEGEIIQKKKRKRKRKGKKILT